MVHDSPYEAPVVAVLRATYRSAEAQIRKALRLLGYAPQRRRILLKPNLVASPLWLPIGGISRCAHTDIRFIEALLHVFDGCEVVIAEGGVGPGGATRTLEKTGIAATARKHGATVVDLDHAERVEVPWKYGTLRLPALLQTHEYIDVPKLKTHVLTGMTLGCKNQKGLLSSADKRRFHQQLNLHEAIRALADVVQPALTIVDGIVGMEGAGPTAGRPRRAGVLVASQDMRAADVACCDLVSMPLERVEHLNRIPYRAAGRTIEDLRLRFDASTEVVNANVHVHVSVRACSRCPVSLHYGSAALFRSPRHLLQMVRHMRRMDVMVGRGHHELPEEHGRVVCYGDCTRELAVQYGVQWVPGCPPSAQEHLQMYA